MRACSKVETEDRRLVNTEHVAALLAAPAELRRATVKSGVEKLVKFDSKNEMVSPSRKEAKHFTFCSACMCFEGADLAIAGTALGERAQGSTY